MAFQLTKTKIKVEGTKDDVIFVNLVINQYLADVNAFTFTWRQPEGKSTLAEHVSFYQKNLSKVVTITVNRDFTFKGIIHAISCNNQDTLGVSYDIIGKGLFMKMDEVPECNSYYQQTIKQIFEDIFKNVENKQGATMDIKPNNAKQLFYTVQYNQTRFEFLRMLAARNGEWMYYNGTALVMGNPGKETISLKQEEDVHDIDITAKLVKASHINTSFDHYKGDKVKGEKKDTAKGGSFMAASVKAGESTFGSNQSAAHISNAANTELIKWISALKQQAAAASSVFITARSYDCKLKLAGKIKIVDKKGGDAGEYIITEIHHTCIADNNYQNQFVAVPAEIEVPPYTNPNLYPLCKPQMALVTENEDDKGLDRIKVQFPWQLDTATTPWITVLTPHAGKDKGIRFLPEIHEEVMVGFVDNNAERPFVMGAVHTEKNKSGNAHKTNNLKIIGTKTGRRMEIDDEEGFMGLADNYKGKTPQNGIKFIKNDKASVAYLVSYKSKNDKSHVLLTNEESLQIALINGGSETAQIVFKKDGSVTINAKGTIDIKADKDMTLKAQNITINASQELKMEGKSGVEVKGAKVELKADTTMDVKGMTTTVEGTAKADFKGGAMASLTAALVKIN